MGIIDVPSKNNRDKVRPVLITIGGCALVFTAALMSGNRAASPSRTIMEHAATFLHDPAIPSFLKPHVTAPKFEYDPSWPKPLPDGWVIASVSGMSVDPVTDDIWVIHRFREPAMAMTEFGKTVSALGSTGLGLFLVDGVPSEANYTVAPPILCFNQAGDLVKSLDPSKGEGYDWPHNPHFIHADANGFLWVGGGLPTPHEYEYPLEKTHDSFVLKLTKEGEFVAQYGTPYAGKGTLDPENFNRPALAIYEPKAHEVYVADGHGNVRISVHDADTFEQKRMWGGYGKTPNISLPQEERYGRTVHCVHVSVDDLVYVCDRDRGLVHVHGTAGEFVTEFSVPDFVKLSVPDQVAGTFADFPGPWDIAFSIDAEQKYLFISTADQMVLVIERATLKLLSTFGAEGPAAGFFNGMHTLNVNTDGDLFISEIGHGRIQKFKSLGEKRFVQYEHYLPFDAPPPGKSNPIYTTGLPFFQMLLHAGCAASPGEPLATCGIDSWLW